MSVIARCAATPSTCDNANDVTAWTMVAAPAANASGMSRSARPLPMTSSIRYLDVAGRTRPTTRLTSINARPSASRPLRARISARASRHAASAESFFLGGPEGSAARAASDRRPRAASDRGIRSPPLSPPGICSLLSRGALPLGLPDTAPRAAASPARSGRVARSLRSLALLDCLGIMRQVLASKPSHKAIRVVRVIRGTREARKRENRDLTPVTMTPLRRRTSQSPLRRRPHRWLRCDSSRASAGRR